MTIYACFNRLTKRLAVQVLLDYGANPWDEDERGMSVLQIAQKNQYTSIEKLIQERQEVYERVQSTP